MVDSFTKNLTQETAQLYMLLLKTEEEEETTT